MLNDLAIQLSRCSIHYQIHWSTKFFHFLQWNDVKYMEHINIYIKKPIMSDKDEAEKT